MVLGSGTSLKKLGRWRTTRGAADRRLRARIAPYFDTEFYCAKYPDIAQGALRPIDHFVRHGRHEGRAPNQQFDPRWYLARYPDVAAAKTDPLLHYVGGGWREGRDPNPHFSTARYASAHPESIAPGWSPLLHSLWRERQMRKKIEPYFDGDFYLSAYPEVAAEGFDPMEHFMSYGHEEQRAPNIQFAPLWYLDANPDVAAAGMDPLIHYIDFGGRELRDPNPHFVASQYAREHPGSVAPGMTPLLHCLHAIKASEARPGTAREQLAPSIPYGASTPVSDAAIRALIKQIFDEEYYRATYPAKLVNVKDAFGHFIDIGMDAFLQPNRWFEVDWYMSTYPSVASSPAEAVRHFVVDGWRQGFDPGPLFCTRFFALRNGIDLDAGPNPLVEFIANGQPQSLVAPHRRLLLVSTYCPTRAHAGGLRILDIYRHIRQSEPDTMIELMTHRNRDIDWRYDEVDATFDIVHDMPNYEATFADFVRLNPALPTYDVIDFQFLPSIEMMNAFRPHAGKMLFTPMELLSRAFEFQNDHIEADPALKAGQQLIIEQENAAARIADRVVCVSEPDAQYLRDLTGLDNVEALETGISSLEFEVDGQLAKREPPIRPTVLYIAYFGSQTNVDALAWYLDEVHPLVKKKVPDYLFRVVGRGDLSKFKDLDDPCVELCGEVPSIGPSIATATIGVAPALYGAGFRGKINQYAFLGLPCVASTIAASGLHYKAGRDILVGDKPAEFARHIVTLLTDSTACEKMGERAHEICVREYSWEARAEQIDRLYAVEQTPLDSHEPMVDVIVPSYRHGKYIRKRIESIFEQKYRNFRLTVIDDCSPDNSDDVIRTLQKSYDFTYIRREQNSGTPFSAWEYAAQRFDGDLIWICESDDFAEPNFLEEATKAFRRDPALCLFYCNSHVVGRDGEKMGTTASYYADIWRDTRWTRAFTAGGRHELAQYQYRGMVVPNMSSALMTVQAFRAAFTPKIKKYRLTGDWLFVGALIQHGNVRFSPERLSNFRDHAETARAQTDMARVQAEFILTKTQLHRLAGKPWRSLSATLATDYQRFKAENASAWAILRAMLTVDPATTRRILFAAPLILWSRAGT